MDLRHDITNKLLIADPILKTSEEKRKVFAATPTVVVSSSVVTCSMEAVTPERKVAIVVMSKYLDDLFCWPKLIL